MIYINKEDNLFFVEYLKKFAKNNKVDCAFVLDDPSFTHFGRRGDIFLSYMTEKDFKVDTQMPCYHISGIGDFNNNYEDWVMTVINHESLHIPIADILDESSGCFNWVDNKGMYDKDGNLKEKYIELYINSRK